MWGEDMKKSIVFEWYKCFKESSHEEITKTVLMTFFDIKGIVYFELIPQDQTVNQAYYYVERLK
jgi:hypothetical protein